MCKKVSQSRFKFLIPIGIVICIAIYHPKKGIQDSDGFWTPRRGFPIPGTGFQSFSVELGFWILDSNLDWDSGLQSPVFRIQPAKFSWIPDSLSKYLPDSEIRIPYIRQYLVQLRIEDCETNTEYKLTFVTDVNKFNSFMSTWSFKNRVAWNLKSSPAHCRQSFKA